MAYYDFNNPGLAQQAIWVSVSAIGGFVLVFSALLLVIILVASHRRPVAAIPPLTFALALRPERKLPASLNSFGVWMLLVVALTIANYGYPLMQLALQPGASVPAYRADSR
jgi:cytochrome c oxidase subunit 1